MWWERATCRRSNRQHFLVSNEPSITLGDLVLYPDGTIELGPHRFSDPGQVQTAHFFDTLIRPLPDSPQDLFVEFEGESFVFRFVPNRREWKKQRIAPVQLQPPATKMEERQPTPPAVRPQPSEDSPAPLEQVSVCQTPLKESAPLRQEPLAPAAPIDELRSDIDQSVPQAQHSLAPEMQLDRFDRRALRRFVVVGSGKDAGRMAQALVDRLRRLEPALKVSLAEILRTGSLPESNLRQGLAVRCVRPLKKSAEAVVDVVFQTERYELAISLSHHDNCPLSNFWRWSRYFGWVSMCGGLILGPLPVFLGRNGEGYLDLDPGWGLACLFLAIPGFIVALMLDSGGWRELTFEERQLSKALPDLVLSSLKEVAEGQNLQEVK